ARDRAGIVVTAEREERPPQCSALTGAMGITMGVENLLDQCRARAWHADDKYRRRIIVAGARPGGEARAIEQRNVGVDESAMHIARERLARRQQLMSRNPVGECAGVLIASGPKFGELVVRHDPVLDHGIG